MAKIFIRPAVHGHIIRHPEKMQHIISQEGEWVEDSMAWQRKLVHGDVVISQPPSEKQAATNPQSKKPTAKEGDE